MTEDTSIESLPNTSSVTIRRLKSLGINTYIDLVNYFPRRYEDYSLVSKIDKLQIGETVTISGLITEAKYQVTRSRLRLQVFSVYDDTGSINVTFFNQPYLLRLIKKGMKVSVSGKVVEFGGKITLEPKEYEIGEGAPRHTARIIPIYPEHRGLSSRTIREKLSFVLANFESEPEMEYLPAEMVSAYNLTGEKEALRQIHFPESEAAAKSAQQRLAFDELFMIQLSSLLVRRQWNKEVASYKFEEREEIGKKIQSFIKNLPFVLTNGQKQVWQEIKEDLSQSRPMNRFLQGEVGSGKTVVAALACYLTYLNGYQTLFMAPTEILAQQHYKTINQLFTGKGPKIALLTGSSKIKDLTPPKAGENYDLIIGTHALIGKKTHFKKIGLVVIDEQHRFGVAQRKALTDKGLNPHLLTMTATPIPRTVALTLYNELDLSFLYDMPSNRLPVRTFVVPNVKRNSCYEWIKKQVKKSQAQAFIVCPLIENSLVETMKSVKAAKSEFEYLKTKIFPELRLGMLHGKMKSVEKGKIMTDFKNKNYDVLVATPVVEVGIDVPEATIMLIEASERFGLASLHQMRGRVGRGDKQSYCFLFTDAESPAILSRLSFFARTSQGNILAEKDLENRGAGNIYGLEQHGIADLKIASLSDFELIKKTRAAADKFMNNFEIKNFPKLKEKLDGLRFQSVGRD